MVFLSILLFITAFIYGTLLMFAKDIAWPVVKWSNSIRGVMSERTEQWELFSTLQGGIVALVSCIFLCRIVTTLNPSPNKSGLLTSSPIASHQALAIDFAPTPAHLHLSAANPYFNFVGKSDTNGVSLSWRLVPREVQYQLNRSLNRAGPYYQLPDGGWGKNGAIYYTDHTANVGATYYYVVTANGEMPNILSNSQIIKVTHNKGTIQTQPNKL